MTLSEKKCIPCNGNTPALDKTTITRLLEELDDRWQAQDSSKLVASFKFDNFLKPMRLAKAFADIAEQESHHPDLLIRWGELEVHIWTHAIKGLSEADFVLASKFDKCHDNYGATL